MKTSVAYRYTGEDPEKLLPLLSIICNTLKRRDIDVYCSFFDDTFKEEGLTQKQIFNHAFHEIDGIDFLFVVLTSEQKSEGMLLEIGYSLAKGIPIVVAVKAGVQKTIIPDIGNVVIAWNTDDELAEKIAGYSFATMKRNV